VAPGANFGKKRLSSSAAANHSAASEELVEQRMSREGYLYVPSSLKLNKGETAAPLLADPVEPKPNHRTLGNPGPAPETRHLRGALGAEDRSLHVFGKDDRKEVHKTTVYPYRAVGQVDVGVDGQVLGTCSGAVVSKNSVLTARHCVQDTDTEGFPFYNLLDFSPGRYYKAATDEVVNPYGTYQMAYISTFVYKPDPKNVDVWADQDMAIITYAADANGVLLGDKTGFLGMSSTCKKRPASLSTGYPGDKPDGSQWSTGVCKPYKEKCDENILVTSCDIMPGQSGSPLYTTVTKPGATVYGVVSFDYTFDDSTPVFPSSYNAFNMITDKKWPFLKKWAGLDDSQSSKPYA
jgi:V8-like Glu-specific endopeptidase